MVTSFIVDAGIIGLPAFNATIGVRSPTFSTTTLIDDNGTCARCKPIMTDCGNTVLTFTLGCVALTRASAASGNDAEPTSAAQTNSHAAFARVTTRRGGIEGGVETEASAEQAMKAMKAELRRERSAA